jgi:hypothetical protein
LQQGVRTNRKIRNQAPRALTGCSATTRSILGETVPCLRPNTLLYPQVNENSGNFKHVPQSRSGHPWIRMQLRKDNRGD